MLFQQKGIEKQKINIAAILVKTLARDILQWQLNDKSGFCLICIHKAMKWEKIPLIIL